MFSSVILVVPWGEGGAVTTEDAEIASKIRDESIIASTREIVEVLNAHDGSDPLGFSDLRGRDVA